MSQRVCADTDSTHVVVASGPWAQECRLLTRCFQFFLRLAVTFVTAVPRLWLCMEGRAADFLDPGTCAFNEYMDYIPAVEKRSHAADGCGHRGCHQGFLELGPNVILIFGLVNTTLVRVAARHHLMRLTRATADW